MDLSWKHDADLISLLLQRLLKIPLRAGWLWSDSLDERLHKKDFASCPKPKHSHKSLRRSCPTFHSVTPRTLRAGILQGFSFLGCFETAWTDGLCWWPERRQEDEAHPSLPLHTAPSSPEELKGKTTATTAADGRGYIWHLGGSSSDVRSKIKRKGRVGGQMSGAAICTTCSDEWRRIRTPWLELWADRKRFPLCQSAWSFRAQD